MDEEGQKSDNVIMSEGCCGDIVSMWWCVSTTTRAVVVEGSENWLSIMVVDECNERWQSLVIIFFFLANREWIKMISVNE